MCWCPSTERTRVRNAACALAAGRGVLSAARLDPDVVEAAFAGGPGARAASRCWGATRSCWSTARTNVAGMAALGASLSEEFSLYGDTVAVVGMLSGRDPTAMLAAPGSGRRLDGGGRGAPDSPRAIPAEDVALAARSLGLTAHVEAQCFAPRLALARGMVDADGLVVVAGSLYVVGDARAEILSEAVRWGGRRGLTLDCQAGADFGFDGGCYCAPLVDRTLVIVKPDGVERGPGRKRSSAALERKGLRLVGRRKWRTITAELAGTHYAEHAERPVLR